MLVDMKNLIEKLLSRKGRIYLYTLGLAVVGLLTAYGFVSGEHATAWTALLAPLFGLAIANVPGDDDGS